MKELALLPIIEMKYMKSYRLTGGLKCLKIIDN